MISFKSFLEGLNPDDAFASIEREALSSPRKAYYHAKDVIKGRWPKGEPTILQNPMVTWRYINNILEKEWPEAEPILQKHSDLAYFYADAFMKRRWPEAEPYIREDPHFAYLYARDVIKGRWPEAEQDILDGALNSASNYSRNVLKPWLKDHPEDREELEAKFGEYL